MSVSRREFLKYSSLVAGPAFLYPRLLFAATTDPNQKVLKEKIDYARSEALAGRPVSEIMVKMGETFLGAPYKANTLEAGAKERLVVNLNEFDCVTFVESMLALARLINRKQTTFDDYRKQLRLIRYRGGVLDGYQSRLHYFTDWIDDNEKKGIVRNVTGEIGGVPYDKPVHFMSTHRASYKHLRNTAAFEAIAAHEAELNARTHFYLPKDRMTAIREKVLDGDILGITTSVEGLDVVHTGIACHHLNYQRLLHAPHSAGAVQISKRTIVDYLGMSENHTGIMVARPLEPTV
jgi:hypothetical protein